jgi:hypothetical protein
LNDGARVLARPRFLKWSLVILVLLVPLVLHAGWDYLESRRLRTLVEEIRSFGEPTTLFAMQPRLELTGEAANAARYYRAAAALAVRENYGRTPSPAAEDALTFLDRAAPLRFDQFPPGTAYSYLTSELLSAARLASARTRSLAERGDGNAAAASLYAQLRLLRAVDNDAARPGPLREAASDTAVVLSQSRPGLDALARLGAEFADLDRDDGLKRMFMRERVMILDHGLRGASWFSRPVAMKALNDRLEELRVMIETAARPWPRPLDLSPPSHAFESSDARAVMRNVDLARARGVAATVALIRAARIAIAATRYFESRGRWPGTIGALVPEYLPSVPVDPYRGEPMRSLVDADSFVVYSVGLNNRDDRGLLSDRAAAVMPGVSPAMAEGDLGVRVSRP